MTLVLIALTALLVLSFAVESYAARRARKAAARIRALLDRDGAR